MEKLTMITLSLLTSFATFASVSGELREYCGHEANSVLIIEKSHPNTAGLVVLGKDIEKVKSKDILSAGGGAMMFFQSDYFVKKGSVMNIQMKRSGKWELVNLANIVKSGDTSKSIYTCLNYDSRYSEVFFSQESTSCILKGCTDERNSNRPLSYDHYTTFTIRDQAGERRYVGTEMQMVSTTYKRSVKKYIKSNLKD